MSEMFTKIGGYIASGDPLVYSDSATMTGDGTVASPFGVNKTDMFVQSPLFTGTSGEGDNVSAYIGWRPDETVLWEAASPSQFYNISPIQLSDNVSAFERIKIIENPWPDNPVKYVHEFVPNNNNYYTINDFWCGGSADYMNCWQMVNTMSFSGGNTVSYLSDYKFRDNASISGPDHAMRIYKIIGINRKPEA